MKNIGFKLLVIGFVLALCIASIMVKEPRLGSDLQGGVSLIYSVDVPPDETDPQEVLRQTIEVLKQRVNPKGVFDITMSPLGRDRIEIIMPLPSPEVRALQQEFEVALDRLVAKSEISTAALDEALRRGEAPQALGGDGTSERALLVGALQEAYDARAAARAALDALAADADPQVRREMEFDLASTNAAYRRAFDAVSDLSLPETRIRRTLNLPDDPVALKDEAGEPQRGAEGEILYGPSARATSLEGLRREFPHVVAEVDQVVAAFDAYQVRRTGFDDPEDLKRLLRGAGVLQFHIALASARPGDVDVADMREQLQDVGPENVVSPTVGWFPINKLDQWYDSPEELQLLEAEPESYFATRRGLVASRYEGRYYLLIYRTPARSMTHDQGAPWTLSRAGTGVDQLGRPAVVFEFNASGAQRMGRLTGGNMGEPMAIVLDGEVYSAPSIRGQITSNGQITGNFTPQEVQYLIRVLAAGSLSARLSAEPISTSILGPTIGEDNKRRGSEAFVISIIAVAVFMLAYYFLAGIVANIALLANGIIIFGVMMGIDGTFTLPGLAGIVLTIGMAVDANVLIYERIREEIFTGENDLRACVRLGYAKALSTILDGNITNLIVCFVLFQTATTEVKGFALTLTIGICATLFTALFVTRQIYFLYTDMLRAKTLPMLPTVYPALHRALEPNINWMGLRPIFWTVSLVAVVGSLTVVASRGNDLLDTEFRGGVSLVMRTETDESGSRSMLRQSDVEDRIRAIADRADAPGLSEEQSIVLREFANAAIQTVGTAATDADGAVIASDFQVKVSAPRGLDEERTITDVVVDAIISEFEGQLDVTPPLHFAGASSDDSGDHVFPITRPELGENVDRAEATLRLPEFVGGAAILVEGVEPPTTVADVTDRIERMRGQPDFAIYSARQVSVVGLTPANAEAGTWSDFIIVVLDEHRRYDKVDPEVWYRDVADPEWRLVSTALTQPASLDDVSTFSSSIAQTLKANATVAIVLSLLGILVYIWVRFGSLRYSLAAIAALVHDVSIALGALALTTIVSGSALATTLLVEPFRINLGVVAALLTIIGYSLNDTIVILDRIRENRGKRPLPTPAIVNRSINQTLSRTLLTSLTTLLAVVIMYVEGGSGIRSFTFCLLIGLIVGTYSSIAIAAPLVVGRGPSAGSRPARADDSRGEAALPAVRS